MENREAYLLINPAEYLKPARFIDIQKTAKVMAVQAQGGEHIISKMANGLVETQKTAKAGDFIITNPAGEQYIIGATKFAERYQLTAKDNIYAPVNNPLKAMRLTEDVQFQAPWGEKMYISSGGVLVAGAGNDIYGIQGPEFQNTYSVLVMRGVKEGLSRVGIKNLAAGVGVGLSAYSLYGKISDEHSTFRTALANPATAPLAKTAITLDATALTISASSLAISVNQSWNSAILQGARNTPMLASGARFLGYAGIAIRLTSAAVDFEIARRNHDAPRMRDVLAETAGGLSGGMAFGVAGMKLGAVVGGSIGSVVPVFGTATGAAVGATVLGIAGSVAGAIGMGELSKYALRHTGDGWLKSMFSASAVEPQNNTKQVTRSTAPNGGHFDLLSEQSRLGGIMIPDEIVSARSSHALSRFPSILCGPEFVLH